MSKIGGLSDRCRCCLKPGLLQELWVEFTHDGQREVYGELLAECFAISLQPTECTEQICNSCIRRLRDAFKFKKLVLASEEHLCNEVKQESGYSLKIKNISSLRDAIKEEIKDDECIEEKVEYILCDEGDNMNDEFGTDEYSKQSEDDNAGVEFLEVEFLEEGDQPSETQPAEVQPTEIKKDNVGGRKRKPKETIRGTKDGLGKRKKSSQEEHVHKRKPKDTDETKRIAEETVDRTKGKRKANAKSRRTKNDWRKTKEFQCPEEAAKYVDNLKMKKFTRNISLDGLKVYYRCSLGAYRKNECPAQVYLLHHKDAATVSLFETSDHANHTDGNRGLKFSTRELIIQMYNDGIRKPNAIIEPVTKRKWPKKKKKHELTTTYKKYTEEELRKAIAAVQNDLMTRSEAADYFNVPIKTLGAKIRAEESKDQKQESSNEEDEVRTQNQVQRLKFMEEIKSMLTYTNGTPFKTKSSRYYCAYCTTEGPCFENPEELRAHTRTKHINDRLKGVDAFMRPHFLNEVLKFDIQNLICTICCASVENWNDMLQHLVETHEVELDQAYNKIIPYRLTEELHCALCDERQRMFSMLDGHMNAHYSNYICGECGDTFLSESRMKKHTDTHRVGKFQCPYCRKVFALEKYRKKHIDGVHGEDLKFKCRQCSKKFRLEYSRHLHEITDHQVKAKTISCTICDKVFDWRPYYMKHMRLMHRNIEKKHHCKLCDKQFRMPYELKNHEAWHTGQNVCQMCGKKFSSKQYLSKHLRTHVGDIVSISYDES